LSLTYTDDEDGASDDFQLKIQDREGVWLENWLEEAVDAAAGAKLQISCVITPEGWNTQSGSLKSGICELDSVAASGPPSVITIKGVGLGFSSAIQQTKKSKAWEKYSLSGIANEIAGNGGTSCMFESSSDPYYSRVEQDKESDIAFLKQLCQDAGLSLKCTDGKLVIFSQAQYEAQEPVMTIQKGDGIIDSYKLKSGSADTKYDSCRVTWRDPATGSTITGTAYADDYDAEVSDNQQLEVTAKVSSAAEADTLAAKRLKLYNKFQRTATFSLPGNIKLAAGCTVQLDGWGGWSGKYMIAQAKHTVNDDGYVTQITCRRIS
jgi:phage protein D